MGARVVLGTDLLHIANHLDQVLDDSVYASIANESIPASFDATTQWAGLIHPIRNQERCGSCWAFSASEVLSDRYAISRNTPSPVLSAQDLVSCDDRNMGCEGGYLDRAWDYLVNTGIVTDTCMPYESGDGNVPECPTTCSNQEDEFQKYKAQNSYTIKGAEHMQKDIFEHGPIQVGFYVYSSFYRYHSGIYHKLKHETKPEGAHAVKIVGYGVENGRKYWTVANSWGTDWGEDGFFRILRGHDHCGIESEGYAGLPALESDILVI